MKLTLLASALFSSTAFAGQGRRRRQDTPSSAVSAAPSPAASFAFVICRDASNCAPGQRCQFVTRNPNGSGFSGACVPEDYVYVPPPQPTPLGPCITPYDCRVDERCEYKNPDAGGIGTDGRCVLLNPTLTFESSAPSDVASASNTASATSPTTSSTPTIQLCRDEDNCASTQWCQFVTRNPDGSGFDGTCTDLTDCRGPSGCSTPGDVCVPPAIKPLFAYRDPAIVFTCARSDCRTSPCAEGSFCGLYRDEDYSSYLCFDSASFPATEDCRANGCPGGLCGYNGDGFQCFFDNSTSYSSSSAPSPSSASASQSSLPSSAAPTTGPTAHPEPSPVPSLPSSPHPSPDTAPAPAPAPEASSSPAPAPHSAPSTSAEYHAAPVPTPETEYEECSGEPSGLVHLLKEIMQEIKCIQEDVKTLKGEL